MGSSEMLLCWFVGMFGCDYACGFVPGITWLDALMKVYVPCVLGLGDGEAYDVMFLHYCTGAFLEI